MKPFSQLSACRRRRAAFTVVELLVVIALIGILLAIILPAVQRSRAAARRMQCQSNLHQIGIAAHSYSDVHGQIPGTGAERTGPLYALLPFVDQASLYHQISAMVEVGDRASASSLIGWLDLYNCPARDSSGSSVPGSSTYLRNRGLFQIVGRMRGFDDQFQSPMTWSHVTDGLSQTAYFSEMYGSRRKGQWNIDWPLFPLPKSNDELQLAAALCLWESKTRPADIPDVDGGAPVIGGADGYNHLLPPQHPICFCRPATLLYILPARSEHLGGVNVLWADGHVSFVSETIDASVWRALGTIDGGEVTEVPR